MILVTGAAGHLGNVLVRELVKNREQVRVMVLPGEDLVSLAGLEVEFVEGDVLDIESLKKAMTGIEIVYHLAGIISILPGNGRQMYAVNVHGVRNVAETALLSGVKRLIHTSSIHAFKRVKHGLIIDEKISFALDSPLNTYDRTKAEGTLAVLETVRKGLDAVIVFPTGVIGPYDFRDSEMGKTLLDFASKKWHFLVDGAYDFVDVRDVATGLINACHFGRRGETYILSGIQVKVKEIRRLVAEASGNFAPEIIIPFPIAFFFAYFTELFYRISKSIPKFTKYSLNTLRNNSVINSEKARSELGYVPRPLKETITDTLNWWQAHKLIKFQKSGI